MKKIISKVLFMVLFTMPLYSANITTETYVGTNEAEWYDVNKKENEAITSVQNELDELKKTDPSSSRVQELTAKIESMKNNKTAKEKETGPHPLPWLSKPPLVERSISRVYNAAEQHRINFNIDKHTQEREIAIRAAILSGNKAALDAILNGGGGGGALPPAPPAPPAPPIPPIPPIP